MGEREFTFVAELPPGADWRLMPDGSVIIAHPDHPPKIVRPNGEIEEVKPNG